MRWEQAREVCQGLVPSTLDVGEGTTRLVMITGEPEVYQAAGSAPTLRVRVSVFDLHTLLHRTLDLGPEEFLQLHGIYKFGSVEHPIEIHNVGGQLVFVELAHKAIKKEIRELAGLDRS